jgi:hypothetical protein
VHPDHVADHVAESVAELRARIAKLPALAVTRIDLDGDDLFLHFDKKVWRIVPHRERMIDPTTGRPGLMESRVVELTPPQTVERVLALNLAQYDAQPPTAELLDADRRPLPALAWPKEFGPQGIVPEHPDFRRPFFCRRGLREYHTHFQHEDDPWDLYREGLPLHAVVVELLHDLAVRWYA